MIGYILLLVVMTLMGSVAALFLKKASGFTDLVSLLTNINLYLGAGLYCLAAVINIYILRYIDYSVVLPLTSFTYIWTMILSALIFKEKITIKKAMGVTLIVIGAVFVAI